MAKIKKKKKKKLVKLNADTDVKQKELPFTAGGNARWYSHF